MAAGGHSGRKAAARGGAQVGIDRCFEFRRAMGGGAGGGGDEAAVLADVVQHCHDKLLRLLPEGYIKTAAGRALAAPLHEEIVRFVAAAEAAGGRAGAAEAKAAGGS